MKISHENNISYDRYANINLTYLYIVRGPTQMLSKMNLTNMSI